jgi:hypothetical protein
VSSTTTRRAEDSASEVKNATPPAPSADTSDRDAAVEIVRAYYGAIEARDFIRAYNYWSEPGPPGQTRAQFERGFANTDSVNVEAGPPSQIGAAAGSRYIDVPVVVDAIEKSGTRQRFTGSYTLRRSVVDGATQAQREWRIYKASLRLVPVGK